MEVVMHNSLGLSIAGMVSVGLAPGDRQLERATASLMAIGLFMLNEYPDDEVIRQTLEIGQQGQVTENADGSISITVTPTSDPK